MAYQKPGVEISQVQGTATPILNPADLPSVIVGPGYNIQAFTEALDAQGDPIVYSGLSQVIDLADTNADWYEVTAADRAAYLPYIDLIGIQGPVAGLTKHLSPEEVT